jgi:hypothetical protein
MRVRNHCLQLALVALACVTIFGSSTAQAQIKVTEIWQRGGDDSTPDWFEITNVSGASIDPSVFYYDDDSANPEVDAQLAGISSLAPGESAVYLTSWHDDFPGSDFPPPFDPADALAAFNSFWGVDGAYQVGYILDPDTGGGSGLSGGGDAVYVFDGNTASANVVDFKAYMGDNTNGETWHFDPVSGAASLSANGLLGGFLSVDMSQVGSPGVAVPEPASILLLMLGCVAVAPRRRR